MLDLFRLSILRLDDYFNVFLSWLVGHDYSKRVLTIDNSLSLNIRCGVLRIRKCNFDIFKDLVSH